MQGRILATALVMLLVVSEVTWLTEAKKKGKKKKSDSQLFDSKTLRCLVCQNLIKEFHSAIYMIDPKKMIDTGTFRIDGNGEQKRSVIPFARSQIHLMELVDKVCDKFDDYAQAKFKSNGKPTIIRLMTPSGNMNPLFGEVDIVPDEDLNTKLKFYCQAIVEAHEDIFTELLADEENDDDLEERVCVTESNLCKPSQKDEL